jgi:hypothetical protein
MLEQFTRTLLATILLLLMLAFAVPSAFAARDSHAAIFRARGHRHMTVHHKRRAVRLQTRMTADVSSTVLLGESTLESNPDYVDAGQAEVFRLQAGASDVAGSAHVYVDSRNAARTLIAGLYSDVAGEPGVLLSTGSISTVQSGVWNTVALSPVALAGGKAYWLAVLGEHGTLRYRDREKGPCPSQTSAQTNLGALPLSWRTGRLYASCPVSAYVTAISPVFTQPGTVEISPPIESTPTGSIPTGSIPTGSTPTGSTPTEPAPVESMPPPPTPPVNSSLPVVSGTTTEGQMLSVSSGSWSGSPTSYKYQWQVCNSTGTGCSEVSGATGSTDMLSSADASHTMRVAVTASNSGGSATATSAATAPIAAVSPPPPVQLAPANTAPPAIAGTATEGQTLTASAGTWTESPSSYAYQWQDCEASAVNCSNVSGANGSTFRLAAGDVGHTVRVVVTASNASGSTKAPSAAVGPVGAMAPTAAFTVTPTSPVVGQAIAFDGSSSSCHAAPCSYEWSDDGSATRPIPVLWPLGSGQTLLFTFSGAGTKYVRLVVTDATGQTATVEHNVVVEASEPPPPPPPVAPTNSALPSVGGNPQVGQALTATSGSWEGTTPIAYTYQWQDCNASGEACSNVSGATSAGYTVVEGDVGHTLRAVVTATNSAGSVPASSPATAVVSAVVATKCTTTDTASMSASSIASSVVSAADGSTVCFAVGSYPFIHIVGAAHKAFVTVRPVPGASVVVDGMEVANSSFLRFEGLRMTEGFNMRDSSTAASHDYQFVENTFESPLYGIVLFGGSGPIKKVLIEGNYIHHVHLSDPEVNGKCSAGYAQGQDVTIDNAEGVTIAHNTFDEAAWHYIQGGGAGPEGVDVEHNLFEGKILMACSHLNLWQVWAGGENDTFKDNIAMGEGRGMKNGLSEEAATDGVIFENGAGSVECATTMKNSAIENNLFVNAATSYELQIYTTEGATIKNNTVVGSEWGSALLTEHCGAGHNYTMTHNIDVEDQGTGADFSFGACTGTCLFDYNVSEDTSASQASSTHYTTKWTPTWRTKSWNQATETTMPAGFYVPGNLSFEAGYQGNIGP